MNTRLRNNKLTYLVYLLALGIVLVLSLLVFFFGFMNFGSNEYSDNTILGSVYLGGSSKDDAKSKIKKEVDTYNATESRDYKIKYQGYEYIIDLEIVEINVNSSVNAIQDGSTTNMIVTYTSGNDSKIEDDIKAVSFATSIKDSVDYDKLNSDILESVGMLAVYKAFFLENYIDEDVLLTDENIPLIASSSLIVTEGINVDTLIAKINRIYDEEGKKQISIDDNSLFSIIERFDPESEAVVLEEGETYDNINLSNEELSYLAKGIALTIRNTNFVISEYHYDIAINLGAYSTENPFPYLGCNTLVSSNPTILDDFSFYNPNEIDYFLKITKVDDSNIKFEIYGLEFVNSYSTSIETLTVDHLSTDTSYEEDVRDGVDGLIYKVVRTVTDIDSETISTDIIVYEYYPQKYEITLIVADPDSGVDVTD